MYTSKPELERSGMGFTIMENFMDSNNDLTPFAGQGYDNYFKKKY